MFNKIKSFFSKSPTPKEEIPHWGMGMPDPLGTTGPAKPKKKKAPLKNPLQDTTAKDKATALNEPYVAILSVDIDPNNINSGAFTLDWNDKFLLNLIKAGYKTKDDDTDAIIVDRWFHMVCRNIVLEMYEQQQADPTNRDPDLDTRIINRRPLGDGRSEIS